MMLSRLVAAKVKMFFDLGCPATWASIKVINEDYRHIDIDYVPICDWKLELETNLSNFEKKKAAGEILPDERPAKLTKDVPKIVRETLQSRLHPHWKRIYAESLSRNSVISMVFLTVLKLEFPQFFHLGIEKVGSRQWEDGLPIHKGCFMSTCAREIGIPFRDAEYIVSRLSHRLYRHQLSEWSKEAFSLGAEKSPFFGISDESAPLCFADVFRLAEAKSSTNLQKK